MKTDIYMGGMSDQRIGQKMVEEMNVEHFINAYEEVTDQRLHIIKSSERPDFICEYADGRCVGIEVTRINVSACAYVIDAIGNSVNKKISSVKNDWKERGNTILVLQLLDERMQEIKASITPDIQDDFKSDCFSEMWIADYSGLEAYGNIELFGLYPPKWWGHHIRANPNRKPYG